MSDFTRIEQELEAAGKKYDALKQDLRDVSVLVMLDGGVLTLRAGDGTVHEYPIGIRESRAGTYFQEYDASTALFRQADLSDGVMWGLVVENRKPVWIDGAENRATRLVYYNIRLKAGGRQFKELRRNRKSAWRVAISVKPKTGDSGPPPARDEFPLHLYTEIPSREQAEKALALPETDTTDPLVVQGPGFGNSVYRPGHHHDKPLNFTYHGNSRGQMIVSRAFPGVKDPFYYVVPAQEVTNWLQGYIIDQVAANTAGMAIMVQIIVDVAIGFMPIVGPLYNLFQAGQSARQLYKNWDKMSGWEKALGGLDILLVTLEVPPAVRAAKGAIKLKGNVSTLMKAGVAAQDAKALMVAAGVLADSGAARKVVEELVAGLKAGTKQLSPSDIVKVERLFEEMVAKLPKSERLLAQARFAVRDLPSAREFLGLEVTQELLMKGLRRLTPESLVAIRGLAQESRTTLAMRFAESSRIDEVAVGMNRISSMARPGHVADLFAAVGDDTLLALGRGDVTFHPLLAEAVAKQSTSGKAYKVLMEGSKTRKGFVPGLSAAMNEGRELTSSLRAVQDQFPKLFLSERQLKNLAKLNDKSRALLKDSAVFDSQIRAIASIAGADKAAAAINRMTDTLAGRLKPGVLAGMYERLGPGILHLADKHGLAIAPETIAAMAKKVGNFEATQILLKGTKKSKGWLDGLAEALPSKAALDQALDLVSHPPHKAAVFARWAIRHLDDIPGASIVNAVRGADAERILAALHSTFGPSVESILTSLGRINPSVPGLKNFIGDLAAGGDKAMGASLTLDFVTRNLKPSEIQGFEEAFAVTKRKYDLFANGKYYEFKYWTNLGGKKIDAAMDEFRRDLLGHAKTGFVDLRWVISRDVESYRKAIADLMWDTMVANRAAIKEAKLEFANVERDLQNALDSWLISFF